MSPEAKNFKLEAKSRTLSNPSTRQLRRTAQLPAVLYGHGVKNLNLVVPATRFERVFRQAGRSTLVDVAIDGKTPVKVLIQDVARDPVSGAYLHVDFHQVRMTEKITTAVPLDFTGESKALKELGGVLVKNLNSVNIECLPADLVPAIQVDIGSLNAFEDRIKISDLIAPKGITILGKSDEVVCLVEPPRSEEELKALEEKVEEKVEEVEVAKKPKEEGETAEVGAEAKPETAKAEKKKE